VAPFVSRAKAHERLLVWPFKLCAVGLRYSVPQKCRRKGYAVVKVRYIALLSAKIDSWQGIMSGISGHPTQIYM